MITVKDYEAFCDGDSYWVHDPAYRECMILELVYARSLGAALGANLAATAACPDHASPVDAAAVCHLAASEDGHDEARSLRKFPATPMC